MHKNLIPNECPKCGTPKLGKGSFMFGCFSAYNLIGGKLEQSPVCAELCQLREDKIQLENLHDAAKNGWDREKVLSDYLNNMLEAAIRVIASSEMCCLSRSGDGACTREWGHKRLPKNQHSFLDCKSPCEYNMQEARTIINDEYEIKKDIKELQSNLHERHIELIG